jgi:hypothetical protein
MRVLSSVMIYDFSSKYIRFNHLRQTENQIKNNEVIGNHSEVE